MRLPAIAIASIERAFNSMLAEQDEHIPDVLIGKVVNVSLTGPDISLYFYFQKNRIAVLDAYDKESDASIAGTPIALAAVGLSSKASASDIKLSGDLQLAQAFETLLGRLSFDWEEQLSRYTGDVIAFRVGETIRGLTRWGKRAASDLGEDVRDYLQLETRRLPLAEEVDAFNQAVDEVRAATERLEMRLQRLAQRRFNTGNA